MVPPKWQSVRHKRLPQLAEKGKTVKWGKF